MASTFSVVVSSFNRADWLRQTVYSVLEQKAADLELIVVNNGSTDATGDYLASVSDPRVSVIHHPDNIGMVPGKNSGISVAKGDWLALIDDDDVWAPDKLSRQLSELESTGRSWSTSGCVYVDADLNILGGNAPQSATALMEGLPRRYTLQGGSSAFLWRRGVLDSDLSSDDVPNMSDWELSLRLSALGLPALVSAPLVAYRQTDTAMSQHTDVFLTELKRLSEIINAVDLEVTKPFMHQFIGSQLLRSGHRLAATQHYLKAVTGGNLEALTRLAAVPLPRQAQKWLRIRLLSDSNWISEAEKWLKPFRARLPRSRNES